MSESILEQVNGALRDHSDIVEFGIVITSEPPYVVVVEGRLGIAMTVLKPLFQEALRVLTTLQSKGCGETDVYMVAGAARALLLVKGDFVPAFVVRKELVSKGCLTVNDELAMTRLILSKHPKSPAAWFHRRWVISSTKFCPSLEEELSVCARACDVYPKNYYAWNYRLWLLSFFSTGDLERELDFCVSWLQSHVSDHSAVNHFIQVLDRLIRSGVHSARKGFVCSTTLLHQRPGHESLWYFRRMLVMMVLRTLDDTATTPYDVEVIVNDISKSEEEDDIDEYIDEENVDFGSIKGLLESEARFVTKIFNNENCWEYEKQSRYAAKYIMFVSSQVPHIKRIFLNAYL